MADISIDSARSTLDNCLVLVKLNCVDGFTVIDIYYTFITCNKFPSIRGTLSSPVWPTLCFIRVSVIQAELSRDTYTVQQWRGGVQVK